MTVPHYGKRYPGALTASSPGDTLYFAFGSYNDSGDSEQITPTSSFAVTDIEVVKDGGATVRATDSGYSLISDTGQLGDRVGLYRFSVQLFNTADDASFYASGHWYQVLVDSVTIDGKTVRFWLGSFEIGEPRANIVQMVGDTGAADVLQKFAATSGALSPAGELDTGSVTDGSVVHANARRVNNDTGAASVLAQFAGTNGTLSPTGELDTGSVANNSYLPANVIRMNSDTGAASVLQQFANTNGTLSPTGELDTGSVANNSYLPSNVIRLVGDTGAANWLKQTYAAGFADTGINDRLAKIAADTDTGIQSSVNVTSFSDTGINDRLAKILADTDTGIQSSVNVTTFADTGVNERLTTIEDKTNSLTFSVAGQVDANIQAVNDTQVQGTGESGNEWRPT